MKTNSSAHLEQIHKYAKIARGVSPDVKKSIIDSIPKDLYCEVDGGIKQVRKRLASSDIGAMGLLQETLASQIIEGADFVRNLREAFVFEGDMTSDIFKAPISRPVGFAPEVAEGAEIPRYEAEFGNVILSDRLIALAPQVTRKMIEDDKWGAVARLFYEAGMAVENTINRKLLTTFLNGITEIYDTGGVDQGRLAISSAIEQMATGDPNNGGGYVADSVLMNFSYYKVLLDELATTYIDGSNMSTGAIGTGQLPVMYGLTQYTTNMLPDPDKYDGARWAFKEAGDIGAVVYNRDAVMRYGIPRDITIENFEDPLHDSEGVTITCRLAAEFVSDNEKAAIAILY